MIMRALLLTLLLSAPAYAQSPADTALAQSLFDEGIRLLNAGDFAAACPKFEESLKHLPGLGTRGKLAECYEKAGRLASAWATWKEVAVLSAREQDARREQFARNRATALEPRVPRLAISVAADNAPGLAVSIDGTVVGAAALGAVPVDPGRRPIEATAPGHKPHVQDVEVTEGFNATVEIPVLEAAPTAPPEEPPPAAVTPPPVADEPPSPMQKWLGIGAVAAGGAALVVGLGFGLHANSEWNEAYDDGHCTGDTCTPTGQDLTDSARFSANVANVLVIGGAVIAATGGVLWWMAPSESTTVGISPGGVTLRARF